MKKILINAMTIKEGGGAVGFVKTFNEMIKQDAETHYFVVIDEVLRSKIEVTDRVIILTFPWIKKSPLHLLYWNECVLLQLVKKLGINVVYSQINTLPFLKLPCKELLFVGHAGYFSPDFIRLNKKYNRSIKQKIGWFVRKQWVFYSIKKADKITVPTKALGDEISHQLKIDNKNIAVILPGSGLAEGQVAVKSMPDKKPIRIGYITKYGVQKNFEVLFEAAAKLKLSNVDFKLILTLNENHAPFQHVNALIQKYDIADLIENHGESSEMALRDLYLTLDLFVFPSLCESIGFTLLEAMYYAIPVIAANTASNRELLGESGIYFNPYDATDLFQAITLFTENTDLYQQQSQYSFDQSRTFSWQESASTTLRALNV
jgi:glycosyltransferase involved in cell wall biosynthesis